ncbi:MAG: hypothetical protein IT422_25995 [Pirellulaceae bacterium]|jgi:hypothetical protein|nr:hypothetical protein [Pirellulaceae bacterium]
MRTFSRLGMLLSLAWLLGPAPAFAIDAADDISEPLRQLGAIDSADQPSSAAAAWKQVAEADVRQLPRVLAAIDTEHPLAANWLRSAADAMVERAIAEGQPLPLDELEQFIHETEHGPRARRLAFELLREVEPKRAESLIPAMLQDPSVELRRESVALRMSEAEQYQQSGERDSAITAYRQALDGARDEDQVKQIAESLRGLDQELDLPRHFGFIQNWQMIAPFDNTGQAGLEIAYPPESTIDLQAEYQGKDGPARWQAYSGKDDFGTIDFNKPFGALKEVAGYAWTEFNSDSEQQVELRLGCKTSWAVWVNGEKLFSHNEYHRGVKMDQYRVKAKFKPGPNEILMKVCQNEQIEDWTVEWEFQLRVCDATGTAILPVNP